MKSLSFTDTPFLLPATEQGRKTMHEYILAAAPKTEYFPVGRSVAGRELTCYKIGYGGGRVTFFGTHHALESITANLLYTIVYILSCSDFCGFSFGIDPDLFLSLYTLYVVPCVNPDGVELRFRGYSTSPIASRFSHLRADFPLWQANERGVDLNHNYDCGFLEYKRIEVEGGITPGRTLYSGEYPESEPESRAVASLVRVLSPSAVVSLHTQGEEIFYSPAAAHRTAVRLAALTGYTLSQPTGTAAYGGLCDYTGGVLGIPSFTLELGRGTNPLPESALPYIFPRVAHALLRLPTLI